MSRFLQRSGLLAIVIACLGAPAQAQYNYPGGYGGFGWGGWGGGGTVAGNAAHGMGIYAAGAGAYNQQTAVAQSINADTAMQLNSYIHDSTYRNAASELQRRKNQQKLVTESLEATYTRLRDNPEASDIRSGEALNIILNELTNPKVYTQVVQKSNVPVNSQLVKNIQFQYAANMIAISLADLSERGVPDELATNPAFAENRTQIRDLFGKLRSETDSSGNASIETLRNCRVAIKALQEKVRVVLPVSNVNRAPADNFLKALFGLTKMMETPSVEQFLKGLDKYPSTTLGHLITFMNSFNLRFGRPSSPVQEAAYAQLYPMLASVRDQAQAKGPNPISEPVAAPDPKQLTGFFSAMDYSHFDPQPDPHTNKIPAPPAANAPK